MDFLEENWFTIVGIAIQCGLLKIAFSYIKKYVDKYINRAEARDTATRSLCRTEIIALCHKALKEGYIAYYNLENLEQLHASYRALGGNGAIEKIYAKTIKLPQVED